MHRRAFIVTALFLLVYTPALGQEELEESWQEATIAWDEGRYIHSLELMLEILDSPGGDRLLPRIALQTGDLFHVTEIAEDGRQITISPDGAFAAWVETVGGRTRTEVRPAADETMIEFQGYDVSGLTFSPRHGQAAYFRLDETPDLRRAREEVATIDRREDRAAWFAAFQRLRELEEELRRLFLFDYTGNGVLAEFDTGGLRIDEVRFSPDGSFLHAVARPDDSPVVSGIHSFEVRPSRSPVASEQLVSEEGSISDLIPVAGGRYLVYTVTTRNTPTAGQGGQRGRNLSTSRVCVADLERGETDRYEGRGAVVSADGSTLVIDGGSREVEGQIENAFRVIPLGGEGHERSVTFWGTIRSPVISPDGAHLAFQTMPNVDWEIYLLPLTGDGDITRVTRNLQHDLNPMFLDNSTLLVVRGEGRHRRSYLYRLDQPGHFRLFHNNTVRTFCPEYDRAVSADGRRILISAERDGDTISPERGVYLVDLDRRVTREEVLDRLRRNLDTERDLRRRGERMFEPIREEVREYTSRVSMTKLYEYQKILYDFDTKYIGEPGNQEAADWIFQTLESFGYEPEFQWFEVTPRRGGGDPIRTPNVLAVLPGTVNPGIHYLLSSHFDSNRRGPGADDNNSGIAVLLETARVLADHPLPCSIIFAAFTGEEAGLLGSREFARQADASGLVVKGALNNDMIGWSGDHRLDNTIRYSNAGIRDVQHAGAILFSDLITYDAHYYKSTDAHALYDAFGDVIGGLGSYHVLGNPHYHQVHDVLETVNQELVTESARSIVASMMLLASSPSKVEGIEVVTLTGDDVTEIRWEPNPESDITGYHLEWGRFGEPPSHDMVVTEPRARLENAPTFTTIRIRAMNSRGLTGWDWTVHSPDSGR